jgi:hypothetical protein
LRCESKISMLLHSVGDAIYMKTQNQCCPLFVLTSVLNTIENIYLPYSA